MGDNRDGRMGAGRERRGTIKKLPLYIENGRAIRYNTFLEKYKNAL
ncbi:hypothetical protein HMPREF3293_01564 [Christensenella minuta]|uniref:Uncharacterized protein n=1 Tax=Christensenella minuta TaxID=626937 RepID=A0A136Q4R4_9FIRM|nr:hypothetical protein HMPREF3293_01564 [Christensenella minuta]